MREPICTDSSLAADEPLLGSAPHATAWVCLEQTGPWGRKAFTTSHLDAEVGAAIERLAADVGARPALIRRPGRHADLQRGERVVFVASTRPDAPWLLTATVSDPAVLLDLDWAAAARGDRDAVRASLPTLTTSSAALLLVCTNGTRDTCCARLGRPVAVAAAAEWPDQVWEVTHTSGHRFAPTTVLLPSGYLHGRILDAAKVLDAAVRGEVVLDGLRGRTTWPSAGQVAEGAVREQEAITAMDAVAVAQEGDDLWSVAHRDGRRWQVRVASYEDGLSADSCGKEPTPVRRWRAAVEEFTPAR
ncbi:MAG TPA: sucrase ferredoxin [Marmoricola sp.]